MARQDMTDLLSFATVAKEGSFTRAAKRLGVTQSALSHAMNGLEARLGLQLLNRSTRSVSTTEAGERLLRSVGPQFEQIEVELAALTEFRDKPAGNIRITAPELAAETVLWPVLQRLLPEYPDIHVEVVSSDVRTDIVAERFDAGVRIGEYVEKDMVTVCIAPPMRMAVVGTPGYFKGRSRPRKPEELTAHRCINLARVSRGDLFPWEFERRGREVAVRVGGQLAFTSLRLIRSAALAGLGLAYLPEQEVQADVAEGRLARVLEDWCEPFPSYHLYYPSRRQPAPAFTVLVEALRYRV
ncbi:LysR family transcriptional regulator [Methylorubrum rhodesianum]|uniref:LysR family transcriptional regulator n=1 Tax=Methylorubrum TaxID=2282523 RepID=UPI00161BC45C|nr:MULTISPECIES: LysR family transcriptional regulator [Methylorubrum]MBB5764780.1 DNA-binding transcriptional LysR family regulator [Methylorubrum rhodesianum]MBI1691396.1 LysR family transcriptional regulator [Methylorubrum sp. DB1722]